MVSKWLRRACEGSRQKRNENKSALGAITFHIVDVYAGRAPTTKLDKRQLIVAIVNRLVARWLLRGLRGLQIEAKPTQYARRVRREVPGVKAARSATLSEFARSVMRRDYVR